jgi:hypothetical protein
LAYRIIGENSFNPEENEIIRIAWEAVRRRREAAAKRGKQLRLDRTIQENGYVTYHDYEQYMKERERRERLKVSNWDLARVRYEIKETLLSRGWKPSPGHRETRFYPPESPDLCLLST